MFYFVVPGLICIFLFHTMRGGFKEFNLVGASVFFFAYILYSLFGFYYMISQREELFLEQSSFFWQNVACLLYGAGTFLLFLFRDELSQAGKDLFTPLW